jgi:hypothetical protein
MQGPDLFESPEQGLLTGLVSIKAEDDVVGAPRQKLHVFLCESRSKNAHDVLEASLDHRHDIHVAFNNDSPPFADNVAASPVKVKEQRRFRKKVALGGIQILRPKGLVVSCGSFWLGHDAASKPHKGTSVIMDGDNNAVPHEVKHSGRPFGRI